MSKPFVEIIEQPAEKSFRFRYESEHRAGGSIMGCKTTTKSQSYPKIRIGNFTGDVVLYITCVEKNKPHRQHPHKLTSTNKKSESGEYEWRGHIPRTTKTGELTDIIEFTDIGVSFVKKINIKDSLMKREAKNIDPTRQGFQHKQHPQLIDLHNIRLHFHAMYPKVLSGQTVWCQIGSAISNPITNRKVSDNLKIELLSIDQSSSLGGERVILLCNKVKREDIEVVFSEEDEDRNVIWSKVIKDRALKVHHQFAIAFSTPAYENITEPRKTLIQLRRPSTNDYSEPTCFEFIPPKDQSTQLRRKRYKTKTEELKASLKITEKQAVQTEKPKFKPNIKRDKVLAPTKVSNVPDVAKVSVHPKPQQQPQPQPLVDLGEDDKENTPVPNPMLNYRTPNMYQPILPQQHYDGRYGCYPSNTSHLNDFQPYNYQQYSHNPSVDSLLMADPIRSQMSFNQRSICMPSNGYQQQQQHQQHHQQHLQQHHQQQQNLNQYHPNSMYPDVNDGCTMGGNVACMQPVNSSVNGMPINFHNNVPYTKQLEQTDRSSMNQNPESNGHNLSDLVGTDELMNDRMLSANLNDILELDMDRLTGELGKLDVEG